MGMFYYSFFERLIWKQSLDLSIKLYNYIVSIDYIEDFFRDSRLIQALHKETSATKQTRLVANSQLPQIATWKYLFPELMNRIWITLKV